ncbi:MAG: ribose 1,5-bisphosphate isomerase [Candidatus Bathyarchaeota archaeon]|nr:ribose 1,5-bisphosphate isomerase [Candidatus Bathyarchaeota archaeon]
MLELIQETAQKIRKLEIQGARNVAISAIKALETSSKETKSKNKEEFLQELNEAKKILFETRETEPLMRNIIRCVINQVKNCKSDEIEEFNRIISIATQEFLKVLDNSKKEIANIGARRINESSLILTHCHSSTVTQLLKIAKKNGKSFDIICTETRPRFQGRLTAKEMLELGIKTTLIVDSAARYYINNVDLVLVGSDAITSEGNVINKIGTSAIALAAHEARTPFYVVSELLKFDPQTMRGDYEIIEERSPEEIWKDSPKGLIIKNPAFDITRRDFIHGIICEVGIIPPHSIIDIIRRKYPWVFD